MVNGNTTARFTLHMNFGGSLSANIAAGAITDQFGNPGAAFWKLHRSRLPASGPLPDSPDRR